MTAPDDTDGGTRIARGDGTRIVSPNAKTRVVRPADVPEGDDYRRINLPQPLAERYTVVRQLDGGSEADVLLVAPVDDPDVRCVVKLYRPPHTPADERVREQLALASPDHVVRTIEPPATYRGTAYEVLEFCAAGSLRDLIRDEGPVVPEARVRAVLTEASAALVDLHGTEVDLIHRDLKPENFLLRDRDPLDLVVADFGLSERLDHSTKLYLDTNRTVAYAPPEAVYGTFGRPADWWSLGMCIAEMLLGAHPIVRELGDALNDQTMAQQIGERPIPLADVPEAWQRVCRGLLTRDTTRRWGGDQVSAWLRGEEPEECFDQDLRAPRSAKVQAKFVFRAIEGDGEQTYDDAVLLAHALGRHWDDALELFVGDELTRRGHAKRFEKFLDHAHLTDARNTLAQVGPAAPRLARLRLELDPGCDPVVDGRVLSGGGLAQLAAEAATGHPASSLSTLMTLYDEGLLPLFAGHPDAATWAELDFDWNEISDSVITYLDAVASHTGDQPSDRRTHLLRANVLHALLDDRRASEVSRQAAAYADDDLAREQVWFNRLLTATDAADPPLVRDLVLQTAAPAAVEQTEAEHERLRREQEEERRRRRELRWRSTGQALRLAILGVLLVAVFSGVVLAAAVLHVPDGGSGAVADLAAETALSLLPAVVIAVGLEVGSILLADGLHEHTGRGTWADDLGGELLLPRVVAFAAPFAWAGLHAHDAAGLATSAFGWALVASSVSAAVGRMARVVSLGPTFSIGRQRTLIVALGVLVAVAVGVLGTVAASTAHRHDVAGASAGLASTTQANYGGLCTAADPDRPGRPRAWLTAEASCTISSVSVRVLQLSNTRARGEYQHARLNSTDASGASAHRCRDGASGGGFAGTWSRKSGAYSGRLMCFQTGHVARIEWGDAQGDLYQFASRRGSVGMLYDWWLRHGAQLGNTLGTP
ncbi:MAG: protein kinase [Solirubrobacteraceae bacterium]|nr:protein kinase [Patulibacter sp.]